MENKMQIVDSSYVNCINSTEGDENGRDVSSELLDRLDKARQEIREGNCTVLNNKEEINAFFESL